MKKRNIWICFVILLGQSLWINGIGLWIDHKTSAMQNHREKITKIHHLISQDMECFPVPITYWNQISFQNSQAHLNTPDYSCIGYLLHRLLPKHAQAHPHTPLPW